MANCRMELWLTQGYLKDRCWTKDYDWLMWMWHSTASAAGFLLSCTLLPLLLLYICRWIEVFRTKKLRLAARLLFFSYFGGIILLPIVLIQPIEAHGGRDFLYIDIGTCVQLLIAELLSYALSCRIGTEIDNQFMGRDLSKRLSKFSLACLLLKYRQLTLIVLLLLGWIHSMYYIIAEPYFGYFAYISAAVIMLTAQMVTTISIFDLPLLVAKKVYRWRRAVVSIPKPVCRYVEYAVANVLIYLKLYTYFAWWKVLSLMLMENAITALGYACSECYEHWRLIATKGNLRERKVARKLTWKCLKFEAFFSQQWLIILFSAVLTLTDVHIHRKTRTQSKKNVLYQRVQHYCRGILNLTALSSTSHQLILESLVVHPDVSWFAQLNRAGFNFRIPLRDSKSFLDLIQDEACNKDSGLKDNFLYISQVLQRRYSSFMVIWLKKRDKGILRRIPMTLIERIAGFV